MITQNKKPSDKKPDTENEQAKNIISGSAQDDQLEKLKHGEKSKKDDGNSTTPHTEQ